MRERLGRPLIHQSIHPLHCMVLDAVSFLGERWRGTIWDKQGQDSGEDGRNGGLG
jgi:hypothetical protein